MLIVYGIKNCNSVKKALQWLNDTNIEHEFYDFKKQGITKGYLEDWSNQISWENLLNKKGLTFKKLSEEERKKINDRPSAIEFMLTNTSSIKRPLLEKDGKVITIGFSENEFAEKLKNEIKPC